jgi:hypothetical protein
MPQITLDPLYDAGKWQAAAVTTLAAMVLTARAASVGGQS